ncbi:MAG: single-stranded-DNA-specific exonuclease RecJ [Thermoplasmatota archaeon]
MEAPNTHEWRYRQEDIELSNSISKRLSIHPLLSRILVARGFYDPTDVYEFLNPNLRQLHDPFFMKDMDKAVNRIGEALGSGEKILVHGDYDVDGITSTALLYSVLKEEENGSKISYNLPSRYDGGYGLSRDVIEAASGDGRDLIITVDCGIRSIQEVEFAREKDIDIVITDHHEPGGSLPRAVSVVDPKRPDCRYPFKELSGVGVVFKLAQALEIEDVVKTDPRDYLELVALGSIADLVPLVNENRTLTRYGLEMLGSTGRVGLAALMRECGINPSKGIGSADVAFRLAPRLNAAGRMGHPDLALELLLTDDRVDSDLFARELNTLNFKRQSIGKKLVESILETIRIEGLADDPGIVVAGSDWNPGVLGTSASRIVEMTGKPAIILNIEDGIAKGSGRAPKGFDLINALTGLRSLLLEYGGHERAAGLTLPTGNVDQLRELFNHHIIDRYPDMEFIPVMDIDLDLTLKELDMEGVRSFDLLDPSGVGNPYPTISLREVMVGYDVNAVGDGKHLKFSIQDDFGSVGCIWFNKGELYDAIRPGLLVTIAGQPSINSWQGEDSVQIKIIDLEVIE